MERRMHDTYGMNRKRKKKRFTIKRLIISILIVVISYIALFLIVVPERPNYAFFNGQHPMNIAHRGGASLGPENTLVAFEKVKSLGVDVIEFDVRMSKDGHLVVMHDEEVDRTTNGKGKVAEMTLAELKKLDAAYTFRDIRGNYVYRGQGVTIPTVEDVFKQFGDMRLIIEIKEPQLKNQSNDQMKFEMEKQLWELIKAYNMEKKVLVASFSQQVLDTFNSYAQNQVVLSASEQEAKRFILLHKLFLNRLYRPGSDVFLLPSESGLFNLKDQSIINAAHNLNMHMIYWTINDESTMRELLAKGADGIITDRPDLLIRVMNEMGLRDE